MFKKAILHVGPNKTGTTSIQNTLRDNRKTLQDFGYFYPKCGDRSYFIASHFLADPSKIFGNAVHLDGDPEKINELDKAAINSISEQVNEGNCGTLILSSEWVNCLNNNELRQLKQYLQSISEQIEIVAYIRDPIKHAASLLQQNVWVEGGVLNVDGLSAGAFSNLYHMLSNVFGAEHFTALKFSKSTLKADCVVSDFLTHINLPPDALTQIDILRDNESRSYEALLIADAYSRRVPLKIDGAYNHQRSIIPIIARVHGTKFELDQETIDQLRPRFEQEYRFLKDTFGFTFDETTAPKKVTPQWSTETLDMLVEAFYRVERENLDLKSANRVLQAQLAFHTDTPEVAESLLIEALKSDTSNFAALDLLLKHLDQTDRSDAAISIAYEFYKLNSSSPNHVFAYKNLLLKAGRREEARTIVRQKREPTALPRSLAK